MSRDDIPLGLIALGQSQKERKLITYFDPTRSAV